MTQAETIALMTASLAGLFGLVGGFVTLVRQASSPRLLAFGLAFAGGAMIYISLTELLPQAVEHLALVMPQRHAQSAAAALLIVGLGLVAALDRVLPNQHVDITLPPAQIDRAALARTGMITTLAIAAHNVPEGLASFLAMLESPTIGLPLAAALAIHNIPEGISIAIPVYFATGSRTKALAATALAAAAEPVGALLGLTAIAPLIGPAGYGVVFAILAGAMTFLGLDELLPAAKRYAQGHETVYGLALGMGAIAASLILLG